MESEHSPVDRLPALDDFRGYLRTLVELQIGAQLQAKLDASGIVQQTLLDAHTGQADFRGTTEAELAAWLRTILANNLLNALRGWRTQKRDARRELSLSQQLENASGRLDCVISIDQSTPSQRLIRSERAEQLAIALSQLSNDQRLAVILKHFNDWPLSDIAEYMERSVSAVAGLLKRGLKQLRELLKVSEEGTHRNDQ